MKESLSVRLLYQTTLGRGILKFLVQPKISKMAGRFLDSKCSCFIIPHFIKKNNIDMSDVLIPEGGFSSFNEFFCRKRKQDKAEFDKDKVISPCDAFLTCIPIKKDSVFDVKHTKFSLEDMLGDEKLAQEFEDGYAFVFRLTPTHYHRYAYPACGKVVRAKRISGILHCVRPIVTRQIPIYTQNTREYQVIRTKEFGKIIQMEVGALLVGRITNHDIRKNRLVKAGQEKGYFEFGGSTIILLFQKDKIKPCREFAGKDEADVRLGMPIAEMFRRRCQQS